MRYKSPSHRTLSSSSSSSHTRSNGPSPTLSRSSSFTSTSLSSSSTLIHGEVSSKTSRSSLYFLPSSSPISTCTLSKSVVLGEITSRNPCDFSAIDQLLLSSFSSSGSSEDSSTIVGSESDRIGESAILLSNEDESDLKGAEMTDDEPNWSILSPWEEEYYWADNEDRSPTPTIKGKVFRQAPPPPLSPSSSRTSFSDEFSPYNETRSYHPTHSRVQNRLVKNRTKYRLREGEKQYYPPRPCSCQVDYDDGTTTTSSSEPEIEQKETTLVEKRKMGSKGGTRRSLFLAGATVRGRGMY